MRKNVLVYTVICSALIDKIANLTQIIFNFIRMRKNIDVFFESDVSTLSTHNDNDYVIDLVSNKKLSFKSLYSILQIELKILIEYIRENLALRRIREFISSAAISILFIFKKNKNLRLYVNYQRLNTMIIKCEI